MQYKIEMPLITDLRKHVVCCYFSINFVFKCYLILCMSVIGNVYKMQNCKRNVSSTCQIVETGYNEQFCMYIQKTVHNTLIDNTMYLQWWLLYHISRCWRSLLILIHPLGTNIILLQLLGECKMMMASTRELHQGWLCPGLLLPLLEEAPALGVCGHGAGALHLPPQGEL